jgi:hypothetical protein
LLGIYGTFARSWPRIDTKKLAVLCVESCKCKSNETKEAQVNLMVELKEKAFSTSLTTDVGRSGTVRETT